MAQGEAEFWTNALKKLHRGKNGSVDHSILRVTLQHLMFVLGFYSMNDPFKRKRVSKRPIPTSTSRRQRQEDPSMISANSAGAAAATCVVHDIFSSKFSQAII